MSRRRRGASHVAPLGRLPVFLRAGALIPLGDATGISAEREVLTCGLVEGATGELYEDDGETADWRGDGTPTIRLRVRNGELAIETGSSGGGAVDRIGIRSVEEGGLL